ncbi:hypothetical protein [Pectobacterium polaris]|uniref:hypothetical protein n=1 Tax=Pectobacterium polaris TaxID=2042057 RepID=UPI00240559F4|nr:hypothetical protein [Pectobacterium polaris]MDG0801967.1 hypothetical protein [Pectobacterium polaris]
MKKIKSAWLITWEWFGEHAKVDDEKRIVSIVNYRKSHKYIYDLVGNLYTSHTASVSEKLTFAANSKKTIYPPYYFAKNGITYADIIHCGDNPFLYARRVKNLMINEKSSGNTLIWEELPIPN